MTRLISASRSIAASADDVFSVVTDISWLPEWNAAITSVLEQPDALSVGAEWIVEIHALGRTWQSRSEVETLDPIGRVFAYRSAPDDSNPSYALWTWIVASHPDGALVTVAGELHPLTFVRRALLVRIRARQLAHNELIASLAALEAATAPAIGTFPGTSSGGDQ